MAETNFQTSQGATLLFGSGGKALGTAHVAADHFQQLPVVSFTVPQHSSALEVGPQRADTSGQLENQARHRQDLNIWTFDVTFVGTASVMNKLCLWSFGDGDGTNTLNANDGIGTGETDPIVMNMVHGTSYGNAATIIMPLQGSDSTANDVVVQGCIISSLTFGEAVGSEAGQLTATATFWTAYPPVEEANTVTSDANVEETPKSIFAKSATTLNSEALLLESWEITISRSVERVGSQDYSSYLPFGYVQVGPWECSGSLVCKRDDSIYDLIALTKGSSAGINLSIDESSGFTLDLPDIMIDNTTIDNGGNYLLQNIPFRAFATAGDIDGAIMSLTIA